MCLILIAYKQSARFPLVVAANRDEYYARPTAPAAFWKDAPGVLAGRDLTGGGTWLGVTRGGRFAAVTNFRGPGTNRADAPTRGALVSEYLRGHAPPVSYLDAVAGRGAAYNGFNLVAADTGQLCWYSNRDGPPRVLGPGVYGISNHLLDTPWPKVMRAKSKLSAWLAHDDGRAGGLLDMLADRTEADGAALPDTGVGRERERVLSPIFICSDNYGTRSSTVLIIDAGGHVAFTERSYAPDAELTGTVSLEFDLVTAGAAQLRRAGAAAV